MEARRCVSARVAVDEGTACLVFEGHMGAWDDARCAQRMPASRIGCLEISNVG